jgi:hypothetical protein
MRVQIWKLRLETLFGSIVAAVQADMDKTSQGAQRWPSSRPEGTEYSLLWRSIAAGLREIPYDMNPEDYALETEQQARHFAELPERARLWGATVKDKNIKLILWIQDRALEPERTVDYIARLTGLSIEIVYV